ncbi:hypothetical protein [Youngiibacter fragilis]|uniref:PA14 domain-containing protein n=1 Tax=Youngiibacter fragilis 232.1 TaxID=994573 RepID=V7I0Z3_9CLOT|nr:hypothetical protein [Youngiibacter fragilis]ETA79915.1 hypothetical protein T472_0215460 [Youngiibacter fragilis 232.1]
MKRKYKLMIMFLALSLITATPLSVNAAKKTTIAQLLTAPYNNLSTPAIITDDVEVFYNQVWQNTDADTVLDGNELFIYKDADGSPVPIEVTESMNDTHDNSYEGQDDLYQTYIIENNLTVDYDTQYFDDNGAWIVIVGTPDGKPDLTAPITMVDYLDSNGPWYPQASVFTVIPTPIAYDGTNLEAAIDSLNNNHVWNTDYVDAYQNAWQADWARTYEPVTIDFIDWGNPMENTYPQVGYRFPIELYLYTKLTEPMTAYTMACLEYPSSADEVYGTNGAKFESYYATVLTNKFRAEAINLTYGGVTKINLEPAIGPSGKMNFASAGGGWIPTKAGTYRIFFYVDDPLISFEGAVINNDEHYVFSLGLKAEGLSQNKEGLSYIVNGADFTWIDVTVVEPNGGGGRKTK